MTSYPASLSPARQKRARFGRLPAPLPSPNLDMIPNSNMEPNPRSTDIPNCLRVILIVYLHTPGIRSPHFGHLPSLRLISGVR